MKVLSISILISLFFLASCGSGSKKKDDRELEERKITIKRDYDVIDATSNFVPGWIEDAELWAKNYNKDIEKFRFFSFEIDPQVGKVIACKLAKAHARTDVASEVATFIDQTLSNSIEGDSSIDQNAPKISEVKKYVSNDLKEKIQALIHGAIIAKTHWQKRKYLKSKGAKKDFIGHTCAVLVRMERELLGNLIKKAIEATVDSTTDPKTKEVVKKSLDSAAEKYNKPKEE